MIPWEANKFCWLSQSSSLQLSAALPSSLNPKLLLKALLSSPKSLLKALKLLLKALLSSNQATKPYPTQLIPMTSHHKPPNLTKTLKLTKILLVYSCVTLPLQETSFISWVNISPLLMHLINAFDEYPTMKRICLACILLSIFFPNKRNAHDKYELVALNKVPLHFLAWDLEQFFIHISSNIIYLTPNHLPTIKLNSFIL